MRERPAPWAGRNKSQRGEAATTRDSKRDWLFPIILGALLSGSMVSFAMAWVQRTVPHFEVKTATDHDKVSVQGPKTDKIIRTGD
jgi:hypothetical protein